MKELHLSKYCVQTIDKWVLLEQKGLYICTHWRNGRVVECGGLENR